jgi:hypothetical protein
MTSSQPSGVRVLLAKAAEGAGMSKCRVELTVLLNDAHLRATTLANERMANVEHYTNMDRNG